MKSLVNVLVTTRVDDGNPGIIGTQVDRCLECRCPVYLSPSSFGLLEQHRHVVILCLYCSAETFDPKEYTVVPITDDQRKELEEWQANRN